MTFEAKVKIIADIKKWNANKANPQINTVGQLSNYNQAVKFQIKKGNIPNENPLLKKSITEVNPEDLPMFNAVKKTTARDINNFELNKLVEQANLMGITPNDYITSMKILEKTYMNNTLKGRNIQGQKKQSLYKW